MYTHEQTARLLPDVAHHAQPHLAGALDWVGMDGIEVPVRFDAGDGEPQRASARVGAFVNLHRPDQRGIHMSRLYLLVEHALSTQAVTAQSLRELAAEVSRQIERRRLDRASGTPRSEP